MSVLAVFRAACSKERTEEVDERRLRALVERAAHANPGIAIAAEDFVVYLAERLTGDELLESLAVEDLYLACACSVGDSAALEAFQRRFAPEIALALSKVPDAIEMSDEITQLILSQLLFEDAKGKRGIESYRGRGGLFSWLRVIAVRRALRELARAQRDAPLGDEEILASMAEAPELGYIKELYREAFRAAFASALDELDYDSRVLLRHHYVHGLSIDKLSALHKVHRATAARRLAKSRESLLQGTRRRLLGELRVSSEELDSIMRLIASNLEASLGGLMSSETPR